MKKRVIFALALLLFVGFFSSVYAEVSMTQPENLYNKGDEFGLNVSITESNSMNGFLEIGLECDNNSIQLYKNPISVKAGQQKNVEISTFLDDFLIGDNTGKCIVKSNYVDEVSRSKDFTLSRDIDISVYMSKLTYNPGDEVLIEGNAVKKNGVNLNGFLEVNLPETNFSITSNVIDGKFNSSIQLPSDLPAGTENLVLHAYEKDSDGKISNEGSYTQSLRISQVVRDVKVALNKEDIVPGDELTYTVLVYDQSGKEMIVNAEAKIVDSQGKEVVNKGVSSSSVNSFLTASNSTPGTWIVSGKIGDLNSDKKFSIEEVEKISSEVVNSTLTVKNVGNVYYNKTMEIKIGEVSENKLISLDVGESKRFKLTAPNGNYEIKVNDGNELSLGSVFLTGKAVSVEDEKRINFLTESVTWVWVVIILLLGLAVAYYYRKVAKNDFIGKKPDYPLITDLNVSKSIKKDIQNGKKEKVSVVNLKVNGLSEYMKEDSSAGEVIKRLLGEVRGVKGKIVQSGENFNMVFAPIMTRESDNSLRAVKIAKLIKEEFDSHNKKYAQKINYGLGVHEGEMIVELNQGDLKFNALGNSLSYAKKMADSANEEIYLSNPIHALTRAKVKVEKSKDGFYWKVNAIPDSEKHTKFIRKFMERQSD